jgi:hypothetical protein
MLGFAERAQNGRDPALIGEFPMAVAERGLDAPWRGAAVWLYANWLALLVRERARRLNPAAPVGLPGERILRPRPSYARA